MSATSLKTKMRRSSSSLWNVCRAISSKPIIGRKMSPRKSDTQRLIDNHLRPSDIEGFREALKKSDRVPAWLKFSDIMLEDPTLLVREDFLSLLKVLGAHQISSMRTVITEMRNLDMVVDEETYQIILVALIKQPDYSKITAMFKEMTQYFKPTISSYNILLKMYLVKSIDDGLNMVKMIEREGLMLDSQSYNILISAFIYHSKDEEAEMFYHQ